MPVTFPAHQGLIVGAKLRWPRHIDDTALCVGAAAPDLAYALGPWLNRHSHTLVGLAVFAVPVTLVAVGLIRWRVAQGVFAHMPDLGPLRLRSYAVLSEGKHSWPLALLSSLIGAGSHIFIDGFTHPARFGAQWLGFDRVVVSTPIFDEVTIAGVFQYLGHTAGSLAFVGALILISSRGALEQWYGASEVAEARAKQATNMSLFWVLALGPPVLALFLAPSLGRPPVFLAITVGFVSLHLAGAITADRS